MKALLILTVIGHVITGCTDCMMTFTPKGRFSFSAMSSNEEMSAIFEGMPLRRLISSVLYGILGLTLCFFGYNELSQWVGDFSHACGTVMYIGTVCFFLPGIAHHVFCGIAEWFYVRLGRTADALQVITEFFKKTSVTMIVCYLGLLAYSAALFIAVVSGKTDIPRWGCIFNPALLTIIFTLLRVPAGANIGGGAAFLGLLFLI